MNITKQSTQLVGKRPIPSQQELNAKLFERKPCKKKASPKKRGTSFSYSNIFFTKESKKQDRKESNETHLMFRIAARHRTYCYPYSSNDCP